MVVFKRNVYLRSNIFLRSYITLYLKHCPTDKVFVDTVSKNPFFSLPTYQMPGVDTMPTTEPIREKPIKQTFPQDKFSTSVEKNPSSSSQCGTRMQDGDPFPLVVNGYTVREGEFPWLVAMFTKSSNSNFGPSFTFRCCGSLVSNKHVLTGK